MLKKLFKAVLAVLLACMIIFAFGRYGWKIGGFKACGGSGISNVCVNEDNVVIEGFNASSFPGGYIGCVHEEKDGVLYVGFRYSSIFGFFETAKFEETIKVSSEIHKVVMTSAEYEYVIWEREN